MASDDLVGPGHDGDEDFGQIPCQLRQLQKQRNTMLREKLRLRSTALSLIRTVLGFDPNADMQEKERKKICDQAQRILEALWGGKEQREEDMEIAGSIGMPVLKVYQSVEPIEETLKHYEKKMRSLAKKLPIADWAKNEPGVNFDTIAHIIGETGSPGNYPHWKHFAKRMGMAPYKGKMGSSWKRADTDALTAEEWQELGYNGSRRSIMHSWGESQVRNNTAYRPPFDEWKEYELSRDDENAPASRGHAHKRALICIERMMLRRLWEAWRDTVGKEAE